MASYSPTHSDNLSGRHCSSCNAPEKGSWEYDASEEDWEFTSRPIEHHITCSDLTAPAIDHITWDLLAQYGEKQPIIPRPFGPTLEGSRRCESGSLASGGNITYCTCSVCY